MNKIPTFDDQYKIFRKTEIELGLFCKKIQNVPIWDYIRFNIWTKILIETEVSDHGHRYAMPSNLKSRLLIKFKEIENAVILNPYRMKKCEYLFIGHGSRRRKKLEDGSFWDIYCDPIIDHLGRDKCILLEKPEKGKHCSINRTKRLASTSGMDLCTSIEGRLKSTIITLSEKEILLIKELDSVLSGKFDLTSLGILGIVRETLRYRQIAIPHIINTLEKLKPRAIFITNSYAGREIYIEAAKSLLIPVIELQHGTISPYHMGYSYPEGTWKTLIPDYFLSFGKFWEETVKLPVNINQIETMGYPYFEKELPNSHNEKEKLITFISQGPIGKKLSQFAVGLQNILPSDWKIIYKLHPGEVYEWKQFYPELADSKIDVITKDNPSLYEILDKSKIQIGVYSTAIYEGLALNCKTYLVNLSGIEYLQPLIDKNICILVNEPNEIDLLDKNSQIYFDKNYFFSDNWKQNLDNAMKNWSLI